jgi:hypothetical protein
MAEPKLAQNPRKPHNPHNNLLYKYCLWARVTDRTFELVILIAGTVLMVLIQIGSKPQASKLVSALELQKRTVEIAILSDG